MSSVTAAGEGEILLYYLIAFNCLFFSTQRRDSSQSLSVSPQLIPTFVDETRGEETYNEHISSSEPPVFGSLQHLASSQTKKPDCLDDTDAVTQPVVTESPGGQSVKNKHTDNQHMS